MNSVPISYLGVWQRRLLTTAKGARDDRSTVFWLQTPLLHGDLRLPALAYPEVASLEECSSEQMLLLSEQSGFAGLTQVEDDLCYWHRLIDYQPVGGTADIGEMRFDGADRLIETALDGSYQETWERLPHSLGINWGQWLRPADESARNACLLVAGDCFLFAAGRPVGLRRGGQLREHIAAASPARQLALMAFELSFGRIAGAGEPWQITHSSLPGRAGQALLPANCRADSAETIGAEPIARLGSYPPAGGWVCVPTPDFIAPQETPP
ncbi:hypothetical protein [Stutzerimonas tarimensis]|uniref:Uncharacterized protein n=1 Tax=Stutzerimonas tarimensis TaxID=1507735 RepID=A0ABV7T508_9GAMM